MNDSLAQREAPSAGRGLQRKDSYGGAPNAQRDSDDVSFVRAFRGSALPETKMTGQSARTANRRLSSPPPVVHQRHMPVGTQKFHIPRKTKEKLALFQPLSCESREYEDMLTILTSGYLDPASSGSFTYSKPRLVHSETLEKEFVEKRKELKTDGRTEKELEESYCFMFVDSYRLQALCEKGLFVGQSWITVLGNPQKGVYLSRCSDLLQMNPFTPGAVGEILIFKVIKGKVKSIYENMKNLLDPTPRFDSHLSKNISKVTSVLSYRAFELTQHYFYEYSFDELRQRPRQVCPYGVVSFTFKGKDTPLTSKPMAPLRSNSQSSDKSQECAQFTVWSGDLVKDDKVLFQVSLRSSSPPFLPHKLPEKLEINYVMSWAQATRRLPQSIFSYNLYDNSSHEVEKDGLHCSLLEVVDKSRSMTSVTKLMKELENNSVVLVTPLTERGFLFLLSSVQMASTHERGENWKRSLHALFVFPESRSTKSTHQSVCLEPSPDSVSADTVMPGFNHFVPALHFALGKARTNPPQELSAGVELHAREYVNGIKEGVLRPYPMGNYEPELEQAGRQYPVPKLHRLGLDTCLRPYLCTAATHLLQLSRVRAMVHSLCVKLNQKPEPERTHSHSDQKMQQLIDLVLSCKRNAEKEVQDEMRSGAKRKRVEQETAQRAIKHLKASQELQHLNAPHQQDTTEVASPGSLTSLIGSVGLKDTDLQDERSELASKLLSLLTNLSQKATNQNAPETGPKESSPFDRLALKLGLPPNCDIDLRKQEDFEAGSVSSQEGGFSPSADSRPQIHKDRDPRRRPSTMTAPVVSEEEPAQPEIPWVLIPISGLPPPRFFRKDTEPPKDPRLHHQAPTITVPAPLSVDTLPTASHSLPPPCIPMETVTAATTSNPSTPDPSPPGSPSQCPSPDPSSPPSHCPSPEPDQEPAPEPSPEPCEAFNDPSADRGEAFVARREDKEFPDSRGTAEPCPVENPGPPAPVAYSSVLLSPKPSSDEKDEKEPEKFLEDVLSLEAMSPPLLVQDINSIVDLHLGSFTSDIKRILQNHSVPYVVPQLPHSTSSKPERSSSTLFHAPMSQYVSFYHACPPVERYVTSLQRQMSSILSDYANNITPDIPDTTTSTTAAPSVDLASRVSEFVASIRAANDDREPIPEAEMWQTDTEGQVATSSMDYMDNLMQSNIITCDPENDVDRFGDDISGSRQVQFSSNHLEIRIRNKPEHSSSSSRDVEEVREANAASPPLNSDQNTLNTLIDQLQPEVYTNLVEIIKDMKRNAQHFYIHCAEEDDYTIQQIRAQLLKQSYIEKSPVLFLKQEENSNQKLLVVIKNDDIADHIHQIPDLLSLKRHPSVQFLGVDSVEDLKNQSCQELFVTGGQVLPDEMVLNPDCVSHDKLSAVLSVLEKHSSAENLWRWKVHCKTHKKLKEQSRFRRDAASLLDVLLSFQKKQIVDFLPYHKCDTSQGCELLDCARELQGRYSNYRHTVVLTENRLGSSSGGGVIVSGIEEFLLDFRKLVGYKDSDVASTISEEPQSTQDPSQSGLVPSEDMVSGSISIHSEQDFEVLHRAISQLRAERQQQLRNSMSNTTNDRQGAVSTMDVMTTSVSTTEQQPFTPPTDTAVVNETVTPGRQAVAATLDLIYSSLHPADEDQTPNQAPVQTQVQTKVQAADPNDHRSCSEPQVPTNSTGQRRSLDTQVQSRVQVVPEDHRSPETKVIIEPTDARTSPLSTNPALNQTSVQLQTSTDQQRSQDTKTLDQTPTQSKNPAETQQLLKDPKQCLESKVLVPTAPGGSQESSMPSTTQREVTIPGTSTPPAAAASIQPSGPNQSSSTQGKRTTPSSDPDSRTQNKKKRKRKSMVPYNVVETPRVTKWLQLAGARGEELQLQQMFNPNFWDSIAMIREGCLPQRSPITPIIPSKLAEWRSQSRLRKVVEPLTRVKRGNPGPWSNGWWPTRVTIFDSHQGPWALVEKVSWNNVVTPVFMIEGQYMDRSRTNQNYYSEGYNFPNYQQQHHYDEDGCDGMIMYF